MQAMHNSIFSIMLGLINLAYSYNSLHYSGKNSFNYKGSLVKRVEKVCKLCGKKYQKYPSEMNRSKFCSKHCLNVHNYLNMPKKETSIEKVVREWLDEERIEYAQQKLLLNTTFADFFIAPNVAVYRDGSYWHSKPYAQSHDRYVNRILLENGFELVRLSEKEIKDSSGRSKLISLIKNR